MGLKTVSTILWSRLVVLSLISVSGTGVAGTGHAGASAHPYVVERVEIAAGDLTLFGLRYRAPVVNAPSPTVVVLHGWLPAGSVGAGVISGLAFQFQQAGYTAVALSLRGWPETGGDDDCGEQQAADVLHAARWLARQPGVDATRVALVGHSQGAQVALLAAAAGAPVYAVVAYAPPTDLARWATMSDVPGIVEYVATTCSEEGGLEVRSPLALADRLQVPVLLVHGLEDTRVPPEHSLQLRDAIEKAGGVARLHLVAGAGHAMADIESLPEVLNFLQEAVRD